MTKNEYLLKMISDKEDWQIPMPLFRKQNKVIQIKEGSVYKGVFRIQLVEDLLFECFVESEKGLVEPESMFISSKRPQVEYRIDATGLTKDYIYEDSIKCWYPGGKAKIHFEFQVVEDARIEIKPAKVRSRALVEMGGVREAKVSNRDLLSLDSRQEISVSFRRRTYYLNEPVIVEVKNKSGHPKRIILETKDELLTPSKADIYLRDVWEQEWFIKQRGINRLLTSFFVSDPFRDIDINIYVDGEVYPSLTKTITLTKLKKYPTSQEIKSDKEFKKMQIQINREYVEYIVLPKSKKDTNYLLDLLRACLNYNQRATGVRLLYIWLLLEFAYKKEAKNELALTKKYREYFDEDGRLDQLTILEQIVNNDKSDQAIDLNIAEDDSSWITLLAKARFTLNKSQRYEFYKKLYKNGLRKSYFFAEVCALENKSPTPVDKDDLMYVKVLKWAINKGALSKTWLNKLEGYYYQLEHNNECKSHLAEYLYNRKSSKNFLRLLCSLCIQEDRRDLKALEIYVKVLESRLFVADVLPLYLKATYMNGIEPNLSYIKQLKDISQLEEDVKSFIYVNIFEKRSQYGLLFRRVLSQVLKDLYQKEAFRDYDYQLLNVMFDEWKVKEAGLYDKVLEGNRPKDMIRCPWGKSLISKWISGFTSDSSRLDEDTNMLLNIFDRLGQEEVCRLVTYQKTVDLNTYLLETVSSDHQQYKCLLNQAYMHLEDLVCKENTEELILKGILCDDFVYPLHSLYNQLEDQAKKRIEDTWIYYISKRIVMNEEPVNLELIEMMIDYYSQQDKRYDWLSLAIVRAIDYGQDLFGNYFDKVFEKRDIMIEAWTKSEIKNEMNSLKYLAHPESILRINYRYEEDEDFRECQMVHRAFGLFEHPIKLYNDDHIQYYIRVSDPMGKSKIVMSDELFAANDQVDISENYIENRINMLIDSYRLNDEESKQVFMDELLAFDKAVKNIPRM